LRIKKGRENMKNENEERIKDKIKYKEKNRRKKFNFAKEETYYKRKQFTTARYN